MVPPTCAVVFGFAYERLVAFYKDAIGLPLVSVEDSHTILDAGGMWLIIHPVLEHVAAEMAVALPAHRREAGAIKLMLNVSSIASAREKASRFGGLIDSPAEQWEWRDVVCCKGHDPEGNVFEVMQLSS